MPETTEAGSIRLHTVTVMRWIAVAGQAFTILFVHVSLGIPLPLGLLLPAVASTAIINIVLLIVHGTRARLTERAATILFGYDIVQLCWLLLFTGGLQNPFSILILLPVTLAAATLGFAATAALVGIGLLGATVLAMFPGPLPWRHEAVVIAPLLLLAAWTALSMALILIAIFTWSIAEETRRHAAALAATQLALAREQRLSALGGQAAAAAHLLGSPLGTINIIAKELVRELPPDSPLREEAADLLDQARRCGAILAEFGRRPGAGDDHLFTSAPLSSLLHGIADEFMRPEITVRVEVDAPADIPEPAVALSAGLRHALANLVDNAIQFATSEVELLIRLDRAGLELVIADDGPGFSPEILDWLGEPYISSRSGAGGMGLGVFIASTLLARTGAKLHFYNVAEGARVQIFWPTTSLEGLREETHDGG